MELRACKTVGRAHEAGEARQSACQGELVPRLTRHFGDREAAHMTAESGPAPLPLDSQEVSEQH